MTQVARAFAQIHFSFTKGNREKEREKKTVFLFPLTTRTIGHNSINARNCPTVLDAPIDVFFFLHQIILFVCTLVPIEMTFSSLPCLLCLGSNFKVTWVLSTPCCCRIMSWLLWRSIAVSYGTALWIVIPRLNDCNVLKPPYHHHHHHHHHHEYICVEDKLF